MSLFKARQYMDDNILNFQNRNSTIRKLERFLLVFLIVCAIPLTIIAYIIFLSPKILNSLTTLISITALIQFEVCGLFGYLDFFHKEIERIYEESGCVPSNLTRSIYEFYSPEPGLRNFIFNQIYFNKRIGFYLLLIAGLLQVFIDYFI
jgi:hypothetical protein